MKTKKPGWLKVAFGTVISNIEVWYRKYPQIATLLGRGGEPSYTGKIINEFSALNCSTVYACVRRISDSIAMLPLNLFERDTDDERVLLSRSKLFRLLHYSPNPFMTSALFRQTLQAHALLWGNGYARIMRRSGSDEPISLWTIPPNFIRPRRDTDGTVYYEVDTQNGKERLGFRDVFQIPGLGFDGMQGYSVITLARNSVGLDMSAQEFGARFFARGGRVPYILKHPQKFKTETLRDQFIEEWERQYGGTEGYGKGVLLEGGLDYQQIGFKPEDSQFLATRKFSVPEIARWFLVPPHMVGDLSEAKFNSVEALGIDFLQSCLGYWLKLWEQQIWLQVFSERAQETQYVEFDTNYFQRGDFESRMKGYAAALLNGMMNIDGVCQRENLPRPPNGAGAAYHIPLNVQTLPGTGMPTAIEQATLARAGVSLNGETTGTV